MTDLLRWGSLSFPQREGFRARARNSLQFALRQRSAAALVAATAVGIGTIAWLGVGYVHYERLAAAQQAAVRHAESANADLQDALSKLRDQLGATSQTLNTTQREIAALSDEARRQIAVSEQAANSKSDRVDQLAQALDRAQRELHLAEVQRVTLMARLSKAEADLANGQARQQEAKAGVDQWQRKVQELTAERDRTAGERDKLRARIGTLEQRLSQLQTRQSPRPLAEARPAPGTPAAQAPARSAEAAPAAPQPRTETAIAVPNHHGLAQFERVLASAGVDVKHLFTQFGVSNGEGGPFIPAPRGAHPTDTLSSAQLAALARLVKALPVSAPLQSFHIGSGFGVRHDPFNGRSSFHTGLDFDAPYMSPVYATAAGVVTFAGYRADYGKIVEIDHGHGISTRYGHLHRYTVSVGQHVAAHTQIGFLGSTGRATGPHVHYEVLVNGEPQNPEKFLGLAHLVPVAARQ